MTDLPSEGIKSTAFRTVIALLDVLAESPPCNTIRLRVEYGADAQYDSASSFAQRENAIAEPKEPYGAPCSRAAPRDAMTASSVRVSSIWARSAAHRVRAARPMQFDAAAQP